MKNVQSTSVAIPPMDIQRIQIKVIGDSLLCTHNWDAKAKQEMLDKQMKKAKQKKAAKDPEACFKSGLYHHPDGGYALPAVAFKKAMVSACSQIDGITKVLARGAFHVIGEFVQIQGSEPTMRQDMVRIGMGTSDIRFRPEFKEWFCVLDIAYNAAVLSPEQIANLLNVAGFAVGVGENRPEKSGGSWGMFHVATDKDDQQLAA